MNFFEKLEAAKQALSEENVPVSQKGEDDFGDEETE